MLGNARHQVVSAGVPAPAADWLLSPAVMHRLTWLHERPVPPQRDVPHELFKGCWAIPLHAETSDWRGIFAIVLTEEALQTNDFACGCSEQDINAGDARTSLLKYCQAGSRVPDAISLILQFTREDAEIGTSTDNVLREFSDKLIQSYEETHVLFRVMRYMASSGTPSEQMTLVCNQVQQVLPFDWVAITFKDSENVEPSLRGQQIIAGTVPVHKNSCEKEIHSMLDLQQSDNWTRILTPAANTLARLLGAEVVCDPITYQGVVIGSLLAGNKSGSDPNIASPEMQFIDAVADFLGTFHENAMRFAEQQAMFLGTLQALTAAIDAKDRYTSGHSDRVAYLSWQMALALVYSAADAERVRIAGLVHDIGKIGVPEAILCKNGKLTDEEFAAIKLHPEIGHGILRGIRQLADVLPGVLYHHERYDGRGYPHRLQGESIPMIARIIGLADTMDAMSSNRSYRPAIQRPDVLKEILKNAGAQFDPMVVAAFQKVDLAGYDAQLTQHAAVYTQPLKAAA
ncbi:MAG: HD domain-containing protein, partial [Pyrinomonadaceae bacterium]|nr:HD domain-containing protein [Phycisphaerales bacterium]